MSAIASERWSISFSSFGTSRGRRSAKSGARSRLMGGEYHGVYKRSHIVGRFVSADRASQLDLPRSRRWRRPCFTPWRGSEAMKFASWFLIGYAVFLAGVGAALWKIGFLERVGAEWTAIGFLIAVGLGLMLAIGGRRSIEIDRT